MAEFLDYEADVEDGYEDQVNDRFVDEESDDSLIDDSLIEGNELSFYRSLNQQLENVGDVNTILQEELEEQYKEAENLEPNNLVHEGESLSNTKLNNSSQYLNRFKLTFFPVESTNLTFKQALQYAVRFVKVKLTDTCENFENNLANQFDDDLKIELDLNKFENTCYHINEILSQENLFLRVYEIKNDYREIRLKTTENTKIEKQLFSCLKIKFNGFEILKKKVSSKISTNYYPVDILYQPVRNEDEVVKCFVSSDMSKSFRYSFTSENSVRHATTGQVVYECYYCQKYMRDKGKFNKHVKVCSGKPGVIYNFNTQNLVTYENNIKYKGDLPMTFYFDFETTAPTDETLYDPSQKEMFVVSYTIIVCFHPELQFERIIIQRSFSHNKEELCSLNYLTREQLHFVDNKLLHQLKDVATKVLGRKFQNALSEMFCTELFLLKSTLTSWFYKKQTVLNLDEEKKTKFEQSTFISTERKCLICNFKLDLSPTSHLTNRKEMTYGDFVIRFEHKFLRNIYSPAQLNKSNVPKLEDYYKIYVDLINIYEELKSIDVFNSLECLSHKILGKVKSFGNETLQELKDNINMLEVKNNVYSSGNRRFTPTSIQIKTIFYIYQNLIDLPGSFTYETIVTKMFIKHFWRLRRCKIHVHHSHVTGKIKGYVHDFCNLAFQEKKEEITVVAHNLMKFDAFYIVKGFRGPIWKSKDISMGGSNITNLNFMSIENVKFIDSMKYFQQSLANLTSTITEGEKESVQKVTRKYIENHHYFKNVWFYLSLQQQKDILEVVSSGKGVIPYEMINNIDSLDQKPEREFFNKTEFFSTLKNKVVNDNEYQKSKELFNVLKMRHLGDMNDLYNFQDTILLAEIMESRFQLMQNKYGFNPRKCNSAAIFSGCVEREMSKIIIALPTSFEVLELFENTLNGGFSSVNNRLGFDTEIFLPNSNRKIESSQLKDYNYKVIYNLNKGDDYRIISKVLKFDENNQYGYAMTKPMPTGCIHLNSDISYRTFNLLLEKVTLDDSIGHLYVVDISLNFDNLTERQKIYNEISPPIIEKNSSIDVLERSSYQLLENSQILDSGKYKKYDVTKKAHATLHEKKYFPLYLEHLAFLVKRLGWKVTKIYKHYQFEQERFKKDFIVVNQKARQVSTNKVEKDFYKLLNNSNFGYDCRNNLDNHYFVPLFDELEDISYLQKYYSLFDPDLKEFVKGDTLEQEIEQKYQDRLSKIKTEDKYYDIKKNQIEHLRKSDLEALKFFKEKNKRQKKRKTIKEYDNFLDLAYKDQNIKTIIEFDKRQVCSIKSLAVKKTSPVNITTRFMKGKMLMFAKSSILSFNYDLIDIFMFPNEEIQKIYEENDIIRCFLYQNLTDTDSTSLTFLFVCKYSCNLLENKARNLIFEIMLKSKVKDRLDLSDDFWNKFNSQNKSLKKQVGLYEAENIDTPNLVTIAINPKEYYELYKDKTHNKKCKGIRKDTLGMDFENYANRLDSKDLRKNEPKVTQGRFQVKTNAMVMTTVNKNKFAQLNDKRFYFMNGINSLPFGHFLLNESKVFKQNIKNKIHEEIEKNADKLKQLEANALKKNTRLYLYDNILRKKPKLKGIFTEVKPKLVTKNTKEFIIDGNWK